LRSQSVAGNANAACQGYEPVRQPDFTPINILLVGIVILLVLGLVTKVILDWAKVIP